MTRLCIILFALLMLSGLSLVNSHHQARKLYIALEQLSEDAKFFDQEYEQLQLEQSTWAMHSRVELIASSRLHMEVPSQSRIQVVALTASTPTQSIAQTLGAGGAHAVAPAIDEKRASTPVGQE